MGKKKKLLKAISKKLDGVTKELEELRTEVAELRSALVTQRSRAEVQASNPTHDGKDAGVTAGGEEMHLPTESLHSSVEGEVPEEE